MNESGPAALLDQDALNYAIGSTAGLDVFDLGYDNSFYPINWLLNGIDVPGDSRTTTG